MLVFLDTTGAVTATAPSTTGRNSAAMSTIYIVAPISGAATLSLSFRLPNGDEVNPALADTVHNAVEILEGVPLPDNQRVWSYAIPSSVTRIAGTVTYTITTRTESMTGTGSGTFYVTPATTNTAPSAPTDGDAWADLLAKLSELYSVEETILGNTPVKKLDGETITTVTALLADLVELIGKDGAESPIGGSPTITALLDWVKDEALRLDAIIGSGSIPFAATITEAINALNDAKVSKTSEASAIYGTDDKGTPATIPYSVGVKYDGHGNATSIPLRDNSGHVKTADPSAVDDAVSLGYHNREVGAITDGLRELDNIVKGRSRALVFDNWEDALVAITSKGADDLQIGDAILIRDLGAPDAWISGISPNYDPYPGGIGVTNPFGDNALTFVVGWYAISPLESHKVNLAEYAKEDDLNRLTKEVANLRANIPPEYFVTDSSVEYAKHVPTNALPFAEVQEVGGMTHAVDGALKNAAVTAIESVGKNLQAPFESPSFVYAGVTFTTNADGTVSAKGTATGEIFRFMPPFKAKPSSTYTFGGSPSGGTTSTYYVAFRQLDESGEKIGDTGEYGEGASYKVNANIVEAQLGLCIRKGQNVDFVFSPYAYEGNATKEYIPYVKRTYPIPAEVQALEGYGLGISADCHNRIDWEKKQYRQEVARVRLPSAYDAGGYAESTNRYYIRLSYLGLAGNPTFLCDGLEMNEVIDGNTNTGICMNSGRTVFNIRIAGLTTRQEYRDYFAENEVYVVAQLAEPIVTDISAILPDDNFIEVEGGGIVTAVNEDKLAAPTKIEYQLKEANA